MSKIPNAYKKLRLIFLFHFSANSFFCLKPFLKLGIWSFSLSRRSALTKADGVWSLKFEVSARWVGLARKSSLVALAFFLPFTSSPSFAAFGVTSGGGSYTVDTGAGLVFKVNQTSGDITSIQYNGIEYQATDKKSHLISGLGTATVTATTYSTNYIKISIATDSANTVVSNLTHYLMVRNGVNTIYMATYISSEPSVGECRWITRLQSSKLGGGPVPSDVLTGGPVRSWCASTTSVTAR